EDTEPLWSELESILSAAKQVQSWVEQLIARVEPFIKKRKQSVRDQKIVYLREQHRPSDGRRLSFGQIGKQLKMTADAARKAYRREKARSSKCGQSDAFATGHIESSAVKPDGS